MGKKEVILNTIIEEYLKKHMPIGSNELKNKLEMTISSSTIRVYFKKLSYEGILTQLHTSSGRIPTLMALEEYWRDSLEDIDRLEINNIKELKKLVDEFDIYCLLQYENASKLSEIINVNDRFLLIVFENNSIILKYNEKVEKFLKSLIGYDMDSVKSISVNVGLYELRKKIEQLLNENIVLKEKEEVLFEMANTNVEYKNKINYFRNSSIFEHLENGVYFEELVPQGYMAFKYEADIDDKNANILCIGKVENNYKEFLTQITN